MRSTINYKKLPYNPKLRDRAKAFRKAGYLHEVLFRNPVKNKQLNGLDFDRQKIIGNYIVDFYCASLNLVVELDGTSHDNKTEYDAERTAYLESLELVILHYTAKEIFQNMDSVMIDLKERTRKLSGDK